MRKLHQQQEGSLDLLLDTLTNVFGGIILIACLLALLARDAPPTPETNTQQTKALHDASYQAAIAELKQLQTRVQTQEESCNLNERQELQTTLVALKAQLQAIQKEDEEFSQSLVLSEKNQKNNSKNLTTMGEKITVTINEIEQHKDAQEKLKAKIIALNKHKKQLDQQLAQLPEKKPEELRYPKEHKTDQSAEYIVLQHGKIYPCFESKEPSKHMDAEILSTRTIMRPNPELGISPDDTKELTALLQKLKNTNVYCALELHDDSYDAFRKLKPLLFKIELGYGISLSTAPFISFSSEGMAPPPPL